MLVLAFGKAVPEIAVAHMVLHILNGCHTHFNSGIALPQKPDRILLDHKIRSFQNLDMDSISQKLRRILAYRHRK
jgi:hypothetical protein